MGAHKKEKNKGGSLVGTGECPAPADLFQQEKGSKKKKGGDLAKGGDKGMDNQVDCICLHGIPPNGHGKIKWI